jgi:hypothetical protein
MIEIRAAEPADAALILSFIRKLAEYERLQHAVAATQTDIVRDCADSAQAHARRVDALVLALVTTTSHREVEWMTHDVGRIFPREWNRFATAVPDRLRHLPLADAYSTLLFDTDPAVRDHAAQEWCAWEDAHVSLTPGHFPKPRYQNPDYRLQFARLVTVPE